VTGTKILWGQMVLSLTAVLAGLWGATEWTAMRLGFQPALGPAWFFAIGVALLHGSTGGRSQPPAATFT